MDTENKTDLTKLPPPPSGQKGLSFEELQKLPPPPKGQTGLTLDEINTGAKPSTTTEKPVGGKFGETQLPFSKTWKDYRRSKIETADEYANRKAEETGAWFPSTPASEIDTTKSPLPAIGEAFKAVGNTPKSLFNFGKNVLNLFTSTYSHGIKFMADVAQGHFKDAVTDAAESPIGQFVQDPTQIVGGAVKEPLKAVVSGTENLVKNIASGKDIRDSFRESDAEIWKGLQKGLVDLIDDPINNIIMTRGLLEPKETVGAVAKGFAEPVKVGSDIAKTTLKAVKDPVKAFNEAANTISSKFSNLRDVLKSQGKEAAFTALRQTINSSLLRDIGKRDMEAELKSLNPYSDKAKVIKDQIKEIDNKNEFAGEQYKLFSEGHAKMSQEQLKADGIADERSFSDTVKGVLKDYKDETSNLYKESFEYNDGTPIKLDKVGDEVLNSFDTFLNKADFLTEKGNVNVLRGIKNDMTIDNLVTKFGYDGPALREELVTNFDKYPTEILNKIANPDQLESIKEIRDQISNAKSPKVKESLDKVLQEEIKNLDINIDKAKYKPLTAPSFKSYRESIRGAISETLPNVKTQFDNTIKKTMDEGLMRTLESVDKDHAENVKAADERHKLTAESKIASKVNDATTPEETIKIIKNNWDEFIDPRMGFSGEMVQRYRNYIASDILDGAYDRLSKEYNPKKIEKGLADNSKYLGPNQKAILNEVLSSFNIRNTIDTNAKAVTETLKPKLEEAQTKSNIVGELPQIGADAPTIRQNIIKSTNSWDRLNQMSETTGKSPAELGDIVLQSYKDAMDAEIAKPEGAQFDISVLKDTLGTLDNVAKDAVGKSKQEILDAFFGEKRGDLEVWKKAVKEYDKLSKERSLPLLGKALMISFGALMVSVGHTIFGAHKIQQGLKTKAEPTEGRTAGVPKAMVPKKTSPVKEAVKRNVNKLLPKEDVLKAAGAGKDNEPDTTTE